MNNTQELHYVSPKLMWYQIFAKASILCFKFCLVRPNIVTGPPAWSIFCQVITHRQTDKQPQTDTAKKIRTHAHSNINKCT